MKNLISFLFFWFDPLACMEITLTDNPTAEERSRKLLGCLMHRWEHAGAGRAGSSHRGCNPPDHGSTFPILVATSLLVLPEIWK